jgi:polysaccharide export outer membrane protein
MSYLLRICGRSVYAGALAWALFLLAGCGSTPPSKAQLSGPEQGAEGERVTDLMRVGDLVTIDFSGVSDPPTTKHEERIKSDGNITLPFIGAIQAAGKTRGQLQDDIHNAYVPKYYLTLTVIVKSENRFFYVEGMVKTPGRYPHVGEMTVLRCIATAGDFNDFAKKSRVVVTRSNGRKERVNCVDAQTHPERDIPIYPDDHIFVPRRYF